MSNIHIGNNNYLKEDQFIKNSSSKINEHAKYAKLLKEKKGNGS